MLLILLLGVLVVGAVVVPFTWGLIRGPRQPGSLAGAQPGQVVTAPMRPLGRIAETYGGFLVLYLVLAAWRAKDGFYGSGVRRGAACVDTRIGGGVPAGPGTGWAARPGTSLGRTGDLQACVLHPTAGQWALFVLTELPAVLLWSVVLLMILRLVRHAAELGPFTPRAAAMMRQLGWVVIAGSVVVGALAALGTDVITDMVLTPHPFDAGYLVIDGLVQGPLRALVPVPALAGAALLAFGSITRAGAVMDEELRATV
jgi:hypothetical protein